MCRPGWGGGTEGEESCNCGSLPPQTGALPQPTPFTPGPSAGRGGPPLLRLSALRAEAREGDEVEEGASKGPSPCLTTCLWELGRRPRHHK